MNEDKIIKWLEREIKLVKEQIASENRRIQWLTGRLSAHEASLRHIRGRTE